MKKERCRYFRGETRCEQTDDDRRGTKFRDKRVQTNAQKRLHIRLHNSSSSMLLAHLRLT
jgi:hypothetical protein